MPEKVDWLERLKKSENKSRGIKTGKGLRLSSIEGWSIEKLPKLLIVWTFEKISSDAFPSISRPGKFSKKRDIKATVKSYEIYLITEEDKCIVPWEETPIHRELVKKDWTEEWLLELKEKGKRLNEKYHQRPINFQLSFKNGKKLRLQYKVTNYSKLPKCPIYVRNILSPELDKMLGCEFMLWKDHSNIGGKRGFYDNNMARWENQHNRKKSGILHVRKMGMDWIKYPEFKEGKQDYWSGFAIDFLMAKELLGFEDQGGHVTGSDHRLNLQYLDNVDKRVQNNIKSDDLTYKQKSLIDYTEKRKSFFSFMFRKK